MVKLFVSPHIRHDFLCGSFFLKIIEQGNDLLHDSPLCGLVSLHGAAQSSREDVPCSPRRHSSALADIFPPGAHMHKNTGSGHVIRSLPVMTDPEIEEDFRQMYDF